MKNARLDELQAGIKAGGRNVNNLRYSDDTTLMAESNEELKNLLMRVKEDSERINLKLNIKKRRSWPLAPSLHADRSGKRGSSGRFRLLALKSLRMATAALKSEGDCFLAGKL